MSLDPLTPEHLRLGQSCLSTCFVICSFSKKEGCYGGQVLSNKVLAYGLDHSMGTVRSVQFVPRRANMLEHCELRISQKRDSNFAN